MPKPSRKPSRPPVAKRPTKKPRGRPGSARASATVAVAPTVAPTVAPPSPPPAVPLTVDALRELLQTPAGQALRAELLQIAPSSTAPPSPSAVDDGAPFGRAFAPPKTEQVQLRLTEREHLLYRRAAQRGELWPEARGLPIYEALRRLAWEGARARGLTLDAAAAPART